jgi:hypothetical protein
MQLENFREVRSKKLLAASIAAVCFASGVVYEGLIDAQTGNNCVRLFDPISWEAVPLGQALQATGVVEPPVTGDNCPSS